MNKCADTTEWKLGKHSMDMFSNQTDGIQLSSYSWLV